MIKIIRSLAVATLTCWVCWSPILLWAAPVSACTSASLIIPISIWTNAFVHAVLRGSPNPPVETVDLSPNIEGHFVAATFTTKRYKVPSSRLRPGVHRKIVDELSSHLYPNKSRFTYVNPESFLWAVQNRPVQMYSIPPVIGTQGSPSCFLGRRFFRSFCKVNSFTILMLFSWIFSENFAAQNSLNQDEIYCGIVGFFSTVQSPLLFYPFPVGAELQLGYKESRCPFRKNGDGICRVNTNNISKSKTLYIQNKNKRAYYQLDLSCKYLQQFTDKYPNYDLTKFKIKLVRV